MLICFISFKFLKHNSVVFFTYYSFHQIQNVLIFVFTGIINISLELLNVLSISTRFSRKGGRFPTNNFIVSYTHGILCRVHSVNCFSDTTTRLTVAILYPHLFPYFLRTILLEINKVAADNIL